MQFQLHSGKIVFDPLTLPGSWELFTELNYTCIFLDMEYPWYF